MPTRVALAFTLCACSLPLTFACGGDDATASDSATDSRIDSTTDSGRMDASDGSADTSPPDTAMDTAVDTAAGCEGAMVDQPCTDEGASCGGPCTDICSFCNTLRCAGGTWSAFEAVPAPCFACGPDLRCLTGMQYCARTVAGPEGAPDAFECVAPPADCSSDLSCTCLSGAGISGDCSEPSPGEVTVTVFAP